MVGCPQGYGGQFLTCASPRENSRCVGVRTPGNPHGRCAAGAPLLLGLPEPFLIAGSGGLRAPQRGVGQRPTVSAESVHGCLLYPATFLRRPTRVSTVRRDGTARPR